MDTPVPTQPVSDYFQQVRTEIAPVLPDRISSVLEIGCGAGATMGWLRSVRPIGRAVGIDVSDAAAALARASFDEVIVADLGAGHLPLGEERFDLILALDVLEHLPDPWAVVRLLRRHMTKDAVIVASIPNVAHYSVAIPLLWRGDWTYTEDGLLDRTHLRFFTRQTVIGLFEQAGLSVRKLGTNRKAPPLLAKLGFSNPRLNWYTEKLLRTLLPARLTDRQFLIQAGPPA